MSALSKFSGILQLTDLDDYIAPSQECIKPIITDTATKPKVKRIQLEGSDSYSVDAKEPLKKVAITLNDCLACSGCVTSAETVLITQQSQHELYRVLEENEQLTEAVRRIIVVSVSPQSVSSLGTRCQLPATETFNKLVTYFKNLGVNHVLDIAIGREFSLQQCCREFLSRYQRHESDKQALPMLTSACPGWICYAEKTLGSAILPHISTVKSPQQIMGSLVKTYLVRRLAAQSDITPDRVYHVTVMPCYDKKLEASRQDFYNDVYSTRDVDCVLTTG